MNILETGQHLTAHCPIHVQDPPKFRNEHECLGTAAQVGRNAIQVFGRNTIPFLTWLEGQCQDRASRLPATGAFKDIDCNLQHSSYIAILIRSSGKLMLLAWAGAGCFWLTWKNNRLCQCCKSIRCQTLTTCATADVGGKWGTQEARKAYTFSTVESRCSYYHSLTNSFFKASPLFPCLYLCICPVS